MLWHGARIEQYPLANNSIHPVISGVGLFAAFTFFELTTGGAFTDKRLFTLNTKHGYSSSG